MGKTIVIIPAHNEGNEIGTTIKSILNTGIVDEIIVVDDGSTDKTSTIALESGAKVIRNPEKCGKGKALTIGLGNIEEKDVSCVAFIDADLGIYASEVKKIIKPIHEGEADMVVGGFDKVIGIGGFGILKKFTSAGIKNITGMDFKWPLSGQRAVTMESLNRIGRLADGFGVEIAMTLDWAKGGFRIVEVPTTMVHVATGRNAKGFLHRGKQFVGVLKAIIPRAFGKVIYRSWERKD